MKSAEIYIFGEIGEWGYSSSDLQKDLSSNKDAEVINLYIDSPGGLVWDGYAIYNMLKNSGKTINVHILSMCASIATYIALAGDTITMNDTGRFMIHLPSMGAAGDKEAMQRALDELERVENDILDVYENKTKLPREELANMMKEETWMTPQEAKDKGFIDSIKEEMKAVAKYTGKLNSNNKVDKDKDLLTALKAGFSRMETAIKNALDGQPTNVVLETAEGTEFNIYVETTDPSEMIGKNVFWTDADGNKTEDAVPDGEYALVDGQTLVVAGGTIEEVKAADGDGDEDAENKLKNEIATLKEELAKKDEALKNKDTEISELKASSESNTETLKKVQDEMNELKNMALGSGTPRVNNKQTGKKDHPFDLNKGFKIKKR